MTLIVAVYTNEGIVMASDSRVNFNDTTQTGKGRIERMGVHFTDTTYKTFLLNNGSGLSTCGDASVNGRTIAGLIEKFNKEQVRKDTPVSDIPRMITDLFGRGSMDTTFHIAGYEQRGVTSVPKVFVVNLKRGTEEQDAQYSGAVWSGEAETLTKIINGSRIILDGGKEHSIERPEILWNLFTIQDAIDFCKYAIETTANTMKFTKSAKTVGGPIDILLIKPEGQEWIARKKLVG